MSTRTQKHCKGTIVSLAGHKSTKLLIAHNHRFDLSERPEPVFSHSGVLAAKGGTLIAYDYNELLKIVKLCELSAAETLHGLLWTVERSRKAFAVKIPESLKIRLQASVR